MLGLGVSELLIVGGVLFMMLAVVGIIVFVVAKLASANTRSDAARRISELEHQVAELQRNQNRHSGN